MATHNDTAELLTYLSEHAANPPYIPERDDKPCLSFTPDTPRAPGLCAVCGDAERWHKVALAELLATLHDAELGRGQATVAHDLDSVDAVFAALAPGYPTGGAS